MDECCCQSAPPGIFQFARAVSILTVRVFHIHSKPGLPFFCGRQFFRQCNVEALSNGRCGAAGDFSSEGTVPIFGQDMTGRFDPCTTNQRLTYGSGPGLTISFSDTSMTCRLIANSGADCWDAVYTLSIPTLIDDLLAACLANLSLIDLNALQFGQQRTVRNDFFTGAPFFTEGPHAAATLLPDACPNPVAGSNLAASFAIRYGAGGNIFLCNSNGGARIEMPVTDIIVSASRTRFSVNSTWCKRTRGPILVDPTFSTTCFSATGACADTACAHYLPATGVIDVPALNESVHIGLCTAPAAPCNPTPIPF